MGLLAQVADVIDPDKHVERPELADPVSLADYLDPKYAVRPHLKVIGAELAALERGDFDRLLLNTPPQVGKPVYAGSMILMADGSRKRIDEIQVNEWVISHTGNPRRVSAVHRQGVLPTVRIKTFQGRETIAALDHPFLTPEGWVHAGDLRPGMSLATVPRAATMPTSTLTEAGARLLGMIVGDGSVTTSRGGKSFNCAITAYDPANAEQVIRCAAEMGFKTSGTLKQIHLSGGARDFVTEHGLRGATSHTKRVPSAVFTAGPRVIAEFLAGYWDCDGTVTTKGLNRAGGERPDLAVELYSVHRALLEDVQHLLLRLGIKSAIRVKMGRYKGEPHQSWRLQILSRNDITKFRSMVRMTHSKRAAALARNRLPLNEFDHALEPDAVVSVEDAGPNECLCLTVELDHTFTSDDLVVHNSTTAVEWGAFWWLCQHPTAKIVIGSYGDDLALRRGKNIRRLVEKYGSAYGLVLERGSANMKDWQVSAGGGVRSVGVGSAITGMDADVIFIDDPTKNRQEADSLPMRERVYSWYSADVLSRQQPDTKIILIQTPWHPDDLRARVVADEGDRAKGGRWRVVLMAALCEKPDEDPLGRAPGEPLSHPKIADGDTDRLTRHWENLRGAVSARDWRALWQCDPKAPEGVLLSWQMLRERRCWQVEADPCSTPVRVAVAVDPSGGGRDSAGVIGGYLGEDGRCHISHDKSGVMSSADWSRAACEMAADTDADCFIYETNYGGDMVLLAIRTAWDALRREQPDRFGVMVPRLVGVTAKRGKQLRAEPVAQQWKEGRVVTSAYLPDVESEWATWSPGPSSPGRIDASVYLALELLPVPSSGSADNDGALALSQVDMLAGLWRS